MEVEKVIELISIELAWENKIYKLLFPFYITIQHIFLLGGEYNYHMDYIIDFWPSQDIFFFLKI